MNHHFVERPLMKTGILGLLLIPFVILMMNLGPKTYPEGYTSAILAFEFVSDQSELSEVLGDLVTGAEDRRSLDQINHVDFGFMMLYGIFLFLFMARLGDLLDNHLLRKGKFIAPIIVICDALENVQLLKLSKHFGTTGIDFDSVIQMLGIFTWLKWGLLAVAFLLIGRALSRLNRSKWVGYLMMIPIAVGVGAFVSGERWAEDLFGQSIFLSFFIILVYSFTYKRSSVKTS